MKSIATLAIRAIRHELEYTRIVQLNRCNVAGVPSISRQWDKVLAARKQLLEAVKAMKQKRRVVS